MLAFGERVAMQRDAPLLSRRSSAALQGNPICSRGHQFFGGFLSGGRRSPAAGAAEREQARQAGSDDGGEAAAEELTTTSGRPPEQDAWSVIDIELP